MPPTGSSTCSLARQSDGQIIQLNEPPSDPTKPPDERASDPAQHLVELPGIQEQSIDLLIKMENLLRAHVFVHGAESSNFGKSSIRNHLQETIDNEKSNSDIVSEDNFRYIQIIKGLVARKIYRSETFTKFVEDDEELERSPDEFVKYFDSYVPEFHTLEVHIIPKWEKHDLDGLIDFVRNRLNVHFEEFTIINSDTVAFTFSNEEQVAFAMNNIALSKMDGYLLTVSLPIHEVICRILKKSEKRFLHEISVDYKSISKDAPMLIEDGSESHSCDLAVVDKMGESSKSGNVDDDDLEIQIIDVEKTSIKTIEVIDLENVESEFDLENNVKSEIDISSCVEKSKTHALKGADVSSNDSEIGVYVLNNKVDHSASSSKIKIDQSTMSQVSLSNIEMNSTLSAGSGNLVGNDSELSNKRKSKSEVIHSIAPTDGDCNIKIEADIIVGSDLAVRMAVSEIPFNIDNEIQILPKETVFDHNESVMDISKLSAFKNSEIQIAPVVKVFNKSLLAMGNSEMEGQLSVVHDEELNTGTFKIPAKNNCEMHIDPKVTDICHDQELEIDIPNVSSKKNTELSFKDDNSLVDTSEISLDNHRKIQIATEALNNNKEIGRESVSSNDKLDINTSEILANDDYKIRIDPELTINNDVLRMDNTNNDKKVDKASSINTDNVLRMDTCEIQVNNDSKILIASEVTFFDRDISRMASANVSGKNDKEINKNFHSTRDNILEICTSEIPANNDIKIQITPEVKVIYEDVLGMNGAGTLANDDKGIDKELPVSKNNKLECVTFQIPSNNSCEIQIDPEVVTVIDRDNELGIVGSNVSANSNKELSFKNHNILEMDTSEIPAKNHRENQITIESADNDKETRRKSVSNNDELHSFKIPTNDVCKLQIVPDVTLINHYDGLGIDGSSISANKDKEISISADSDNKIKNEIELFVKDNYAIKKDSSEIPPSNVNKVQIKPDVSAISQDVLAVDTKLSHGGGKIKIESPKEVGLKAVNGSDISACERSTKVLKKSEKNKAANHLLLNGASKLPIVASCGSSDNRTYSPTVNYLNDKKENKTIKISTLIIKNNEQYESVDPAIYRKRLSKKLLQIQKENSVLTLTDSKKNHFGTYNKCRESCSKVDKPCSEENIFQPDSIYSLETLAKLIFTPLFKMSRNEEYSWKQATAEVFLKYFKTVFCQVVKESAHVRKKWSTYESYTSSMRSLCSVWNCKMKKIRSVSTFGPAQYDLKYRLLNIESFKWDTGIFIPPIPFFIPVILPLTLVPNCYWHIKEIARKLKWLVCKFTLSANVLDFSIVLERDFSQRVNVYIRECRTKKYTEKHVNSLTKNLKKILVDRKNSLKINFVQLQIRIIPLYDISKPDAYIDDEKEETILLWSQSMLKFNCENILTDAIVELGKLSKKSILVLINNNSYTKIKHLTYECIWALSSKCKKIISRTSSDAFPLPHNYKSFEGTLDDMIKYVKFMYISKGNEVIFLCSTFSKYKLLELYSQLNNCEAAKRVLYLASSSDEADHICSIAKLTTDAYMLVPTKIIPVCLEPKGIKMEFLISFEKIYLCDIERLSYGENSKDMIENSPEFSCLTDNVIFKKVPSKALSAKSKNIQNVSSFKVFSPKRRDLKSKIKKKTPPKFNIRKSNLLSNSKSHFASDEKLHKPTSLIRSKILNTPLQTSEVNHQPLLIDNESKSYCQNGLDRRERNSELSLIFPKTNQMPIGRASNVQKNHLTQGELSQRVIIHKKMNEFENISDSTKQHKFKRPHSQIYESSHAPATVSSSKRICVIEDSKRSNKDSTIRYSPNSNDLVKNLDNYQTQSVKGLYSTNYEECKKKLLIPSNLESEEYSNMADRHDSCWSQDSLRENHVVRGFTNNIRNPWEKCYTMGCDDIGLPDRQRMTYDSQNREFRHNFEMDESNVHSADESNLHSASHVFDSECRRISRIDHYNSNISGKIKQIVDDEKLSCIQKIVKNPACIESEKKGNNADFSDLTAVIQDAVSIALKRVSKSRQAEINQSVASLNAPWRSKKNEAFGLLTDEVEDSFGILERLDFGDWEIRNRRKLKEVQSCNTSDNNISKFSESSTLNSRSFSDNIQREAYRDLRSLIINERSIGHRKDNTQHSKSTFSNPMSSEDRSSMQGNVFTNTGTFVNKDLSHRWNESYNGVEIPFANTWTRAISPDSIGERRNHDYVRPEANDYSRNPMVYDVGDMDSDMRRCSNVHSNSMINDNIRHNDMQHVFNRQQDYRFEQSLDERYKGETENMRLRCHREGHVQQSCDEISLDRSRRRIFDKEACEWDGNSVNYEKISSGRDGNRMNFDRKTGKWDGNRMNSDRKTGEWDGNKSKLEDSVVCWNCSEVGHFRGDCKAKMVICFECHEAGHLKKFCLKRKRSDHRRPRRN